MLGKTNLTAVEGGVIVSDIADYSWNAADISGVTGTFIKTLYANNILVGITAGGAIAHTKDGENWETNRFDLEDDYELSDIAWDGRRFVIVGSHTDNSSYVKGLIIISEDLVAYDVRTRADEEDYFHISSEYVKFSGIMADGNRYVVISNYLKKGNHSGSSIGFEHYICSVVTDLESYSHVYSIEMQYVYCTADNGIEQIEVLNAATVKLSKLDTTFIIYVKILYDKTSSTTVSFETAYHSIFSSGDGTTFELLTRNSNSTYTNDAFSVFGCKGTLYYLSTEKDKYNYQLWKVNGTSESLTVSTGINYAFVDAAYFNKCEIFINAHEMLIVNPKESIADKTLDDLVEITYDFSITSITKAFDKLYVFGSGGKVLVSNDESNNEEALAVKTMSASKALYEAKAYTDKRIEELMALLEV